MKKTLISFVIVLFAALSSAQNDFDKILNAGGALISAGQASNERAKLSKAAARYNADQPNVSLRGEYVVIRAPKDWRYWDDQKVSWYVASMEAAVTAVGAIPVWDTPAIKERADDIRTLRGDDEVDQTTVPPKGSIKAGAFILENVLTEFQRDEEFGVFLGNFWRGADFQMSRNTAYSGSTLTIRRQSGEALAVYKTLACASSADNVSGSLIGGFFGNSVGGFYSTDSRDYLPNRALENNIKEMTSVIKLKCS